MKKNVIYGVITACIALILLIGAGMSVPDPREEPSSSTGTVQTRSPSDAVTSSPAESVVETTLPTQTQPSQPGTKPTAPATQPTEPETKPTVPATQPTESATVPTEDKPSTIVFITWPETITGGETGTVTVQGKPHTVYYIQVYYKSGPSSAKGLEDKLSNADGFVTWTWKVSKNTKPGDYKIVVTDGEETAEVSYSILDKK